MQAIIMAAGLGTRLRPLTNTCPKPMIQILGKPILEHTIDALPPQIDEVIIIVSHLKECVSDYFGNEWKGRRIIYVEQKELLGTGHALTLLKTLVKGKFLVLNGDDLYLAADLKKMLGENLAVLAKEVDDPGRFGVFKTDASGRLLEIIEAPHQGESKLVNIGVYTLDERIFDYPLVPIKGGKEFGLPQTVALMAKDYPVTIVKASFWIPIGYPEDIKKAEESLTSFIAS